jgi:hypothetical protein
MILPSVPTSLKWFIPRRFSDQNVVCISLLFVLCVPCPCPLWFGDLIMCSLMWCIRIKVLIPNFLHPFVTFPCQDSFLKTPSPDFWHIVYIVRIKMTPICRQPVVRNLLGAPDLYVLHSFITICHTQYTESVSKTYMGDFYCIYLRIRPTNLCWPWNI